MPDTLTDNAPRLSDTPPRKEPRGSHKVMDVLKTLAWVAPITIIIWTYAEREGNTPVPKQTTFPIAVRIDAPNRIAILDDPANSQLTAFLSGPSASVNRVIEKLKSSFDHPALIFTVPPGTKRGTQNFQAQTAIGNDSIFVDNGITVSDISPPQLQISVDDMDTQTVQVVAPDGLQNLNGTPQFAPAEVKIRAPHSYFTKENKFVTAEMGTLKELKVPGLHRIPGVAVKWSESGSDVTVEPVAVNVTFTVNSPTETFVAHQVPIWIAGTPSAMKDYHVDISAPLTNGPFLHEIKLEGPPDQLKTLGENLSGKCLLVLQPGDAPRDEDYTGVVHFELPPDVHVLNKPEDYTVSYRVSRAQQ